MARPASSSARIWVAIATNSVRSVSRSARSSTRWSPASIVRKADLLDQAMQISEEKQAVAQYGSSRLSATLGNILGSFSRPHGSREEVSSTATRFGPACREHVGLSCIYPILVFICVRISANASHVDLHQRAELPHEREIE